MMNVTQVLINEHQLILKVLGLLSYKKQGRLDSAMGALRYQHRRCRECIDGIRQALPGYEENDGMALTFLLENLAVYGSLLQRHIYEEDVVFFPLAEKILSSEEKESLFRQFEEEEERIGSSRVVFEKYQSIADHLAQLLP